MKMQELYEDFCWEGFSLSKKPMGALELLLGGHVTGYGRHFKNINSARHKCRF